MTSYSVGITATYRVRSWWSMITPHVPINYTQFLQASTLLTVLTFIVNKKLSTVLSKNLRTTANLTTSKVMGRTLAATETTTVTIKKLLRKSLHTTTATVVTNTRETIIGHISALRKFIKKASNRTYIK